MNSIASKAFVSGGSKGIGRAIVLSLVRDRIPCVFSFCSDQPGANETIRLARELNQEIPVHSVMLDLARRESIEPTVEQVLEDYGPFSVVVNNAGVLQAGAAVLLGDAEWERVIATNLSGPFYLTRAFIGHFLANKQGGRIISISSITHDGASGQAAYAASKAGLVAFTRSLAKEYGPKGITANVIAPGYIETEMTAHGARPGVRESWISACPARRAGTPQDVAGLVSFLVSAQASFINGEVIHLSGGLNYVP